MPVECTLAQLYAWNLPAVLHLQSPIGPPVLDGREQKPQKDHFALFVGMASQGDPRFFDPGVNHLWLIKRNPLDLRAWDDNLEKLYRKRALLVAFPPWELPKEVREALEKRGEWGPLAMSPSVRRIKSPQLSEERGHGTDTLAARSSDLRKQHASRIAAQVIEAREAELVEELGKAQANEKNEARRRELEGLLAIHKQRLATLRDGRKVFADAQGLMKGNDYRRAAELLVFFEDHVDYAPQGSLLALLALVGAEEDVRAMRLCCRLVEERRLKPELLHVGLQAAAGAATRRGDDAFLLWANGAMIQVDPTNELSGLAAWKLDGLHQKLADKGKASPASGQKGGRP
ncbi:MAG: hypothetical protein FJ279_11875 [Planctomycetes bacterium]|nr:hypothetical protein [Planctomycetota bacterium]